MLPVHPQMKNALSVLTGQSRFGANCWDQERRAMIMGKPFEVPSVPPMMNFGVKPGARRGAYSLASRESRMCDSSKEKLLPMQTRCPAAKG